MPDDPKRTVTAGVDFLSVIQTTKFEHSKETVFPITRDGVFDLSESYAFLRILRTLNVLSLVVLDDGQAVFRQPVVPSMRNRLSHSIANLGNQRRYSSPYLSLIVDGMKYDLCMLL